MKKSDQKLLAETLDRALDPPLRRKPALASRLAEYDDTIEPKADESEVAGAPPTVREAGSRGVTPPHPTLPLAPSRDFNKRANSLERLALPAGIFPGSSKKLYDALYVRTRGAIVPKRSVRATKRELSEWSGIRNVKTIDSHLRYFSAVGLIFSEWQLGQNDGALYEVLLPEETSGLFVSTNRSGGVTPPDPMLPHLTPSDGESPQNLGSPHHQNLGSPHQTQAIVDAVVYGDAKTSLKTNTERDDDEAFAEFVEVWRKAANEVTGREPSKAEAARWKELAEVMVAELKIAAARTTVSSVPSFLAEHLRRRLWKIDKKQARAEGKELPDEAIAAAPSEELNNCPDCRSSGWWYPDGLDHGVAKCKHSNLKKET